MLKRQLESSRKRKISLSFKDKAIILKLLDDKLKKQKDIAAEYGISDTTISNWKKNKDQIFKMADLKLAKAKSKVTNGKHPELENAVLEFMRIIRDHRFPINAYVIKEKAKEIAISLNIDDFKASDGWYTGFKNRHDLVLKKTVGHEDRIEPNTINKWREHELPKILANYPLENIYNADETGLFFELLPDKTVTTKYDRCKFHNNSKNRITVMFAVNFSGCDKLQPLVIGKSKNPRCFKNVKSLPVIYESNKSAWMTSKIFNSWVQKVDYQMLKRRKKIILLIDNAPCHNLDSNLVLQNVAVHYLPPNSTSVLQPLDQGIIKCYKSLYKKKLLKMLIDKCMKNTLKNVTLLEAIHLTAEAWDDIDKQVIFNCFNHGFMSHKYIENIEFINAVDGKTEIKELQEILNTTSSFDEICNVDPSLTRETLTLDQVVATVVANISTTDVDEDVYNDEDKEDHILQKPGQQLVHEALNTLKNYLICTENIELELHQSLNKIKRICDFENETKFIQGKLENYGFVLE